ncbi:MAG TPA: glycosyltransferase family 2 protein [Opitutaceae bacterium]|nr:glycosyltransferase family 2 protein [Opitutaceae bacterium]
METISVIIVSWNARDYLRGVLRSLEQTTPGLVEEIFVVDNDSKDGSPEMVEKEFPAVTLVRTGQNLGFAKANNLAMKQARGTQFALINSDVVVHPGCLETLSAHLSSHPGVGLVGPLVFGGDGKPQETRRRLPSVARSIFRAFSIDRFNKPVSEKRNAVQSVEVLNGCFWLAKRSAVEEVGGLDERFFFYAEDVDWCKRFGVAGWKIEFVPAATAIHFGGGSSANAPFRYSVEMLKANLKYWRKHHGVLGQAVYFTLSLLHHLLRMALRGLQLLLRGRNKEDIRYKFDRSKICLCWLLTQREI